MTKTELFEAIATEATGWKTALNEMWSCLNQDEKAKAAALAGSTASFTLPTCDECAWEFLSGGTLELTGAYQAITPPVGAEAAKVQFVSTDTDVATFHIEGAGAGDGAFIVSHGGVITLFNPDEIAGFRIKSASGSGDIVIQYYTIP